jgi:hypothetical protein
VAERLLPARRAHRGIATTADHIWIARNRGKFIRITRVDWTQAVLCGRSGNDAGLQKKGRTMLRKLLGAAAMAAAAYAFVPAHAAHVHHAAYVGVGCSGDNFAKAEGEVETMADGPAKFLAEREIAQAQDAMLSGQMSGCAMHLGRALRAESVAQTAYPGTMGPAPFATTAAQAPAGTTQEALPQPHWNWAPLQGAY